MYDEAIEEALSGPLVTAAPGYFTVQADFPGLEPEPVLAWRIGKACVLPVVRYGCKAREVWVVGPNGKVRLHAPPGPSLVPDFDNIAAWRADEIAKVAPPDGDTPF
jgi:hypothetical protein